MNSANLSNLDSIILYAKTSPQKYEFIINKGI
jgi:hypothetical protein